MKKQFSLLAFFVVLYCVGYFVVSTLLYYISLSQGYGGLGLPLFGGGDDGIVYAKEAINVATDLPVTLTSIHALVLGWVLKVFHTEDIYVLKAFNYVGNVLLVFIALRILQKMMLERKNFVTAAILLVLSLLYYPSLLLNSNLSIFRDVWICLYYLLSILFFANLFVVKSRWPFLFNAFMLVMSVIMLGGYRKYALMSFLIGSVLYVLFIWNRKRKVNYNKIFLVSIIGFSIAYTFLRTVTMPYVNLSFQGVLKYRQDSLDIYSGGSQMWISLDQPNIVWFYLNYFYSLISNTFGPLPWQISGGSTLLVFITESLLFIFIFLFLYKRKKQFSKIDMLLIIHSTIWFMLISISNDNLGTATRLRMIGWIPLLIVFAKYYAEYLTIRKKKNKVIDPKETVIS